MGYGLAEVIHHTALNTTSLRSMTTLQAAAFPDSHTKQLTNFLKEHGLTLAEQADLGEAPTTP